MWLNQGKERYEMKICKNQVTEDLDKDFGFYFKNERLLRFPRSLQSSWKLHLLAPSSGLVLQLNWRAINLKIQLSVRAGVTMCADDCVGV